MEENKSIINWDLHQKMMEKKFGKRKIENTYTQKNPNPVIKEEKDKTPPKPNK
jgi:hypothetical protein